jgi:hypothetical protein
MAAGSQRSIVDEIKYDVRRMHETWMELVYPRQRGASDTVLGKWRPNTQLGLYLYRAWAVVGAPIVALIYPFVLLGAIIRFQTRRIDTAAERIGLIGVVIATAVVWGALAASVRFGLDLSEGAFVALVAAAAVATLSAGLALGFKRVGGRATTVLLAYPFAVTAIFLPPVVAALYSPTIADVVLPGSDNLARWLLDNVLTIGEIDQWLIENFDRQGWAYAIMWFGIAVPVGWILGSLVTLADLVRPTE